MNNFSNNLQRFATWNRGLGTVIYSNWDKSKIPEESLLFKLDNGVRVDETSEPHSFWKKHTNLSVCDKYKWESLLSSAREEERNCIMLAKLCDKNLCIQRKRQHLKKRKGILKCSYVADETTFGFMMTLYFQSLIKCTKSVWIKIFSTCTKMDEVEVLLKVLFASYTWNSGSDQLWSYGFMKHSQQQ